MKFALVLSLVALPLLAMFASRLQAAESLKAGDEAPAFELPASDGKTYKLADFKDKQVVVVAWFPRAFTPGCTNECKSFREHGSDLKKFNVVYFTASCDPVEKNKDFSKSLDLDYPVLSDAEGKVATAYGIYNPEKKAAARTTFYIGKDGKILAIDNKVNTAKHGEDVAARLKELNVEAKP